MLGNIRWLGNIDWLGVMLGLCCLGGSSRFGGSIPFVALMFTQQLQCSGGLGEDADGFGAAHLHRIAVALQGEDLGDSVDGGFEPDGIAGCRPSNDQLQPVLGCPAKSHKPFLRSQCGPLFGANRVSLDDLGLEKSFQPAPRHCTQRGGELRVDPASLLDTEVPSGSGDSPRLIGRHPPNQSGRPNLGKPVPQIQRVTYQPVCRPIGDSQYTAQLGWGKIADRRSAVSTEPHRILSAGQPALRDSIAGMEVSPMRRDLQPAGFRNDQRVFVSLRRGQRGGGIPLH